MTARLAAALTMTLASPALAQSPGDLPAVTEGLIAAAIAYEIGDKCGELDARLLRGIGFLNGLRDAARAAGFSDADIDAYMDNDAEKDRLESEARARMRAMGAVDGDEATYCAVGHSEITAGSQIGRLLR